MSKKSIQASRTAKLWLQFMTMMDILRMFLKGERMGIWELHIQAMYDMMPYLAASGHNLNTKCIHVYLQQMHKLHETHPEVSWHFDQGFHAAHRSDRFRAGLFPDLVIEQVLMRSMKISGGLTRGRGMTETQRLVWLMAHQVCAKVNNAAQRLDHGKARERYGRLVWTIGVSSISKSIQWQLQFESLRQESMMASV